jgi:hypothetical protein
MRVILRASGVWIEGERLKSKMNAGEMEALAGGLAGRTNDIPMHPSGTRRQNVSTSGMVWYIDYPEDRSSHFLLALSPQDTPGCPDTAFSGSIELNGKVLSTDLTERTFPRDGEVRVRGHHRMWSCDVGTHKVFFVFEPRRNAMGKHSGVPRLAYVSIIFGSASEPNAAANGDSG